MKGRTNISGGGMNINADVENFTVASGSNVTAGNFVQYKMEESDKKYDSNSGYTDGARKKVIPCGNNRYVARYANNSSIDLFKFNLIDVSNGFKVLSTVSIQNNYAPDFCVLQDGKLAICYSESGGPYTVRIYDISTKFLLLNTYELEDEQLTTAGYLHITTVGESKILLSKFNKSLICDYSFGEIKEFMYADLGVSHDTRYDYGVHSNGANDWSMFPAGENGIIIFSTFYTSGSLPTDEPRTIHYICFLEIEGYTARLIDRKRIDNGKYLNQFIWGNIFGLNGKILFSIGSTSENDEDDVTYVTKMYYVENDTIVESQSIDLFDCVIDAFSEIGTDIISHKANGEYSSGTAQYIKNNVFYISVLKQPGYGYGKPYYNPKFRTAIARVEYNEDIDEFNVSNVVYFENENTVGTNYSYYYGFGQFFESENGDIYYLYETGNNSTLEKTGRWMMRLTYKNGILEIGENTGMVENYTGSGAAIGVAKQSGKSGDVIEVYTPKV